MLNFDPSIKINGEVGESIIENILYREGLAPRLLAVFPGGRIDEFVPSKILDYETAKDPEVFLKIAEKLARFHSLQMPISKRTDLVQRLLHVLGKGAKTDPDGESRTTCKIPFLNEYKWYDEVIRKVSGRPVFTHGDSNPNNILVLKSKEGSGKDVMFIDYELCSYFFRSYDIAFIMETSRYKGERKDGKMRLTQVGPEYSKEAKLRFLEKYLEEKKKMKSQKFCPVHDSLENMQLEVQLSEVYVILFMIGWTTLLAGNVHPDTEELGKSLHPVFVQKKKEAMSAFNLWNGELNEKCPCTN